MSALWPYRTVRATRYWMGIDSCDYGNRVVYLWCRAALIELNSGIISVDLFRESLHGTIGGFGLEGDCRATDTSPRFTFGSEQYD
jgi:hypothetical protein